MTTPTTTTHRFGRAHETFELEAILEHPRLRTRLELPGIYELRSQKPLDVRVSRGSATTSRSIRIGRANNVSKRLISYATYRSGLPDFERFLEHNHVYVAFWEFDPAHLVAAEADAILFHAEATGRIPLFNQRGEFEVACRALGRCVTDRQKNQYLRRWACEQHEEFNASYARQLWEGWT